MTDNTEDPFNGPALTDGDLGKVLVISGGSSILEADLLALRAALAPLATVLAAGAAPAKNRSWPDRPKDKHKPPPNEIERWNAAVDERKAAKRREKGKP